MIVEEIMTNNPSTVHPDTPLDQVEDLLLELDVRHLPVVDDGLLQGIISDRDVAPFRARDRDTGTEPTAAQLMSSNLVTIDRDADVAEAIDLLIDQRVGALPVVEGESQRLVGIVSYVDLLRAAQSLMAE